MMKARLNNIRDALKLRKADAFLLVNYELSGQPSTRYLSGFSGTESILVITKAKRFIIADSRYYLQARAESSDFILVKREKGSGEILKNLFEREKIKSVLVDGSHTYYSFIESLKRAAKVAVINDQELLHSIRIVKDNQELKHLRKAADISVKAFKGLLPLIKPGVTEQWLAARLEFLIKEAGSPKIAFDTIVASGKNGALPHAKPTAKKIKKGELITIDFGASYNGYMSDITRTVAVGKVPPKLREIYEIVREAQERGCRSVKAGMAGKYIDGICREHITENGYGRYFLHSTGHGLGMSVHELPAITALNIKPLPINSVVTVEPGIYIQGLGGVRIEDALIITKNGSINLHKAAPKELIQLRD